VARVRRRPVRYLMAPRQWLGSLATACLATACLIAACLFVACLFVVSGCQPAADAAPEIRLAWSVRPQPPETGPILVLLTLTDGTTGEPVEGARVRLEATMSHPGMSPVLAAARETSSGRYQASVDLTMAGDWVLLVEAALPDGRTLRRQVALPGVQTSGRPAGAKPAAPLART